jgi:ribonuclease G
LSTELLVSRVGGRTCTALRENGVTVELRVEDERMPLSVGQIIKARVSKILPGIQSAFLDVGQERDAFLHTTDLLLPGESAPPPLAAVEGAFTHDAEDGGEVDAETLPMRRSQRRVQDGPPIQDRLKEGRELVVQVVREAFGGKGPRVTCFITLPGRYLVHAPDEPFRGVSRRIQDPDERQRLRDILAGLPEGAGGFIVRTAGAGAAAEAFQADARFLVNAWRSIEARVGSSPAPSVLHGDLDLFLRALRDAPRGSYDSVVVDDERLHRAGRDYLREIDPQLAARLQQHVGAESLFDATDVSQDIEKALRPRVWLSSGGTIVIEQTEALVSIDVNTGKFVGTRRPEETVLRTNLEAAEEIARQLRLRDLGGIIVVDFIDMEERRNRERVLSALQQALDQDKAPSKALSFNEFGLVCITRKRTKQALERVLCQPCPSCTGSGMVKSIPTLCYEIQNEARKMAVATPDNPNLTLRVHPEIAKALKTRESMLIDELEQTAHKHIIIQSDATLHWEQYDIY